MNKRRLFQVASAMLALIFAIALLVMSVLMILPLVDKTNKPTGLVKEFSDGVQKVVSELKFLQMPNRLGEVLFVMAVYFLPSVLLMFSALLLFTKPSESNAKETFGQILMLLAALLFTVIFEIYADKFFGKKAIAWQMGVGTGAGLILFLVVLSALCKPTKRFVAKAHDPSEAAEEQQSAQQPAQQATAATAAQQPQPTQAPQPQPAPQQAAQRPAAPQPQPTATPQAPQQPVRTTVQQPVPQPVPQAAQKPVQQPVASPQPTVQNVAATATAPKATPAPAQPQEQPLPTEKPIIPPPDILSDKKDIKPEPDYYEPSSVNDVLEHTYGKSSDSLSKSNLKDIAGLRAQLESGAITKEEYIQRVNEFLKGDGK